MRPFTFSQFKDAGFEIPNLHPDFRMETRTDRDWNGRTYQVFSFQVKATSIDPTYPDEWFILFDITEQGYLRDSNADLCNRAGLTLMRNSWDGEKAQLDGLYYKSNPLVTHTQNGKLRKSAWSQLKRRCNVRNWNMSQATLDLLNAVVTDVQRTLPDVDPYEYIKNKDIKVTKCHVTNELMPEYFVKRLRFSDGVKFTKWGIDPRQYGYREVRLSSGSEIFLTENEVMIRDRVYNRDTLVMGTCSICGSETPVEGMIDGECHSCLENKYKIHNYSTKVPSLLKFKAKNVKPNTIYLGIELEYETTDKEIAKVKVGKALAGHAIMKSDGSIRNGFEIVTCPATLEIHMEEFKRFYNNFPKELFPESNTGMHVHVSRKPLNQFTIGKMTEFMNRPDNKAFIAHIAGRIDNSYARMDSTKSVTYPLVHGRGERYSALNLNPDQTIEFRIFSTPANWEQFASRLEFCQALVDYCQPCQVSGSLKQLTGYPSFINWLRNNRKAYPELSNHLKGFA